MKFLPNKGLPAPLYRLLTQDTKVRRAKYSVTELIQPAQMLALKRRHDAEIVCDPLDRVWSLMGKLPHGKLEGAAGAEDLAEEPLLETLCGVSVSAQPDLYSNDGGGTVWDYKFTSHYAVKEPKLEWEQQLNAYAWFFREAGFPVKHLKIVAVLKDWSARKAKLEKDYPQRQVIIMPIKVYPDNVVEAWIEQRVKTHEAAEQLPDSSLPPCTDEERWASERVYAVQKTGRKSAVKLFKADEDKDAKAKADALAAEVGGFVVERPREFRRCQDYCDACEFCEQWRKESKPSVEESLEKAGL